MADEVHPRLLNAEYPQAKYRSRNAGLLARTLKYS